MPKPKAEDYSYNREDTEIEGDFGVIPSGQYVVTIDSVEPKETKAGNGVYFNFMLRINDGQPYANRVIFDPITWRNPSAEAVRIGREQLARLCDALGVKKFAHPNELCGRAMQVRLGIKKDKTGDYGDQNVVRAYIGGAGGSKGAASKDDVPW